MRACPHDAGRRVYVISSRSDTLEVRRESTKELAALGIVHDGLHLLPSIELSQQSCPTGVSIGTPSIFGRRSLLRRRSRCRFSLTMI